MNPTPQILPVRKQVDVVMDILHQRLNTILPEAMRRAGLDMWIILCQEDDPDPVFRTMMPLNAWTPILQMLIFFDRGSEEGVERINLSMTNTFDLYDRPWKGRNHLEQWQLLAQIIGERDPQKIGINTGSINWAAGGLTHNLYQQLVGALPQPYVERLVSAEAAATHWLMSLSPKELEVYPHLVAITHQIIASCYSAATITPGVTTTDDLEYAFWQRSLDLGLELSFTPFFNLVRSQADQAQHTGEGGVNDLVIRPGDLLHCDVGNRYLRLCSDLQEWAYILRPGETDAPAGMKRLMAEGNRLQKVYQGEFHRGLSGDVLLKSILNTAHKENIPNPNVYSHSLGLYLHEPGPLIGLPWEQVSNTGRGEVKLEENSCFTMELSVEAPVPEWGGQSVRMSLEQDVMFTANGCQPMDKVQTEFYLV